MRKIIQIIIFIGLFFNFSRPIMAENIAGSSANMALNTFITNTDIDEMKEYTTKMAIRNVLDRYNSPMIDEVNSFYKTCQKYSLDCYLLPSISGIESTFGRFLMPQSYNPFGWGRGLIYFDNFSQAIDTVGKSLRINYMDKWGAETVDEIGPIYCEGNTWASKVNFFMKQFKDEEAKIQLFLKSNPVQL